MLVVWSLWRTQKKLQENSQNEYKNHESARFHEASGHTHKMKRAHDSKVYDMQEAGVTVAGWGGQTIVFFA
jgi:hypothetical protein